MVCGIVFITVGSAKRDRLFRLRFDGAGLDHVNICVVGGLEHGFYDFHIFTCIGNNDPN